MINQAKLLDGFIYQIVSAKNALFDELNDKYEGLPVNELNAHYRAEYKAVQDALMKCLQILTTESHQLKEQAGQ